MKFNKEEGKVLHLEKRNQSPRYMMGYPARRTPSFHRSCRHPFGEGGKKGASPPGHSFPPKCLRPPGPPPTSPPGGKQEEGGREGAAKRGQEGGSQEWGKGVSAGAMGLPSFPPIPGLPS